MKVLVLYYSKGGNTRKLAEAIAEGVGQTDGVEVVLRHTRDVTRATVEAGQQVHEIFLQAMRKSPACRTCACLRRAE